MRLASFVYDIEIKNKQRGRRKCHSMLHAQTSSTRTNTSRSRLQSSSSWSNGLLTDWCLTQICHIVKVVSPHGGPPDRWRSSQRWADNNSHCIYMSSILQSWLRRAQCDRQCQPI